MQTFKMISIKKLFYFLVIPTAGSIYLKVSHLYSPNFLADRFLPYIISIALLIYLGRQHYLYWDKSFSISKFLSVFNLLIIISFIILQAIFLISINLQHWYLGLISRSAPFYIFPFIISGYVVPFILFSHVLADSIHYSKRIIYIGSAYLIIITCSIFWWVKISLL